MHFPVNIHVGKIIIPIHFVCETSAYFFAYRYYKYLKKKQEDKIGDYNRLIIIVAAAVGALLGSHLVGILENPPLLHEFSFSYFLGNKTIVGGLLGGLVAVEFIKPKLGISESTGDLLVYPIILAMIIGRMGCFFAGIDDGTYGTPTKLPWGIDFGDGIKRQPTNLYEILFWMILALALWLLEKRLCFADGAKFKILMSAYLTFRLADEFLKPDYFFSFGLSVIQIVCVAGIIYYYRVFLYPQKLIKPYA